MRQNWLSNRIFKLLRLEHTHRPALENHVHRATRLGSSRREDDPLNGPEQEGASGPLKQDRLRMDLVIDQLGAEHKKASEDPAGSKVDDRAVLGHESASGSDLVEMG